MRARLIPLGGGAPVELAKDVTLVGRQEDCDIRLDVPSVSKTHCVLVKTEGFLFVRDLGSTNGTKINGQRIRRAALLPGDQLSVGGQKFRVAIGAAEPEMRPDEVTAELPTGWEKEQAAAALMQGEASPAEERQGLAGEPGSPRPAAEPRDPAATVKGDSAAARRRLPVASDVEPVQAAARSDVLPIVGDDWPVPPLEEEQRGQETV